MTDPITNQLQEIRELLDTLSPEEIPWAKDLTERQMEVLNAREALIQAAIEYNGAVAALREEAAKDDYADIPDIEHRVRQLRYLANEAQQVINRQASPSAYDAALEKLDNRICEFERDVSDVSHQMNLAKKASPAQVIIDGQSVADEPAAEGDSAAAADSGRGNHHGYQVLDI